MTNVSKFIQLTTLATLCCGASFFSGCSGEVFGDVEDYRSVVTVRVDESIHDFSNIRTYQIPDTVFDITQLSKTYIPVNHDNDDIILSELHAQMKARGFTNVEESTNTDTDTDTDTNTDTDTDAYEAPAPDIIVTAAIIAQSSWDCQGVVQWDEIGKYAHYPDVSTEMSYLTESLIVTVVSPQKKYNRQPDYFEVLWHAGVHHAFSDINEQNLRSGIAQAFTQSEYLTASTEVSQ